MLITTFQKRHIDGNISFRMSFDDVERGCWCGVEERMPKVVLDSSRFGCYRWVITGRLVRAVEYVQPRRPS